MLHVCICPVTVHVLDIINFIHIYHFICSQHSIPSSRSAWTIHEHFKFDQVDNSPHVYHWCPHINLAQEKYWHSQKLTYLHLSCGLIGKVQEYPHVAKVTGSHFHGHPLIYRTIMQVKLLGVL